MKERKVIHFNIPIEDEDIIRWKNALPPRTFNMYVNAILLAESKDEVARIPRMLSPEKEIEPLNGRLEITDRAILSFIGKINKGYVTSIIKQIIRKQVYTENKPVAKCVHATIVACVLEDFRTLLFEKEIEYVDTPDSDRKLYESFKSATKTLFKAIQDCFDSDSDEMAESRLLHLDCKKIIDDSFNAAFGLRKKEFAIDDIENDWEDSFGEFDLIDAAFLKRKPSTALFS